MKSQPNPIPLVDFAFKHQAPMDALANLIINVTVTWFMLAPSASLPIFSPPGSEFAESLLGTLVPPAVVIAFAISIITTKVTISKRVKGKVLPPLKPGERWIANAMKWGVIRAVVNILAVYGIGGIIVQFTPDVYVSRLCATMIVGAIAAALAYLESASAVLRTPKARSHIAPPYAVD